MIEVRFRPITETDWPQAPTKARGSAQFRSTLRSTLRLLDVELRTLEAKDVVIETGHQKRDIRLDGWPRSDARVPSFPGVILSFGSKHGPLRYLTDVYASGGYVANDGWMKGWEANLRAIALSLEALRAVDRYGVSRRGEQYRGWGELPSGVPMPAAMTIEEAATLLEHFSDTKPRALADWTPEHLAGLCRRAAKKTHPDVGGDPEVFRKVTAARILLEGYVR